jgi:hypothetical protein
MVGSPVFGVEESAMEFTNGFVLESEDGVLAGFMLGSPGFQADAGDCVFMPHYASESAGQTSLGLAIAALKAAGQHAWRKEKQGFIVHSTGHILLTIGQNGDVLDAQGNIIGMAKPLPASRTSTERADNP